MVKKTTPEAGFNDPKESSYVATLVIGGVEVAHITVRAATDKKALEELEKAKPIYFEGLGDWKMIKLTSLEVSPD